MIKNGRWKIALAVLAAAFLVFTVVRSVLAGPQTMPNARDKEKAAREVKPARGVDERADLPTTGAFVAGNGIIEPADRETKVASQVAGRIARVLVKEGDAVELGAPLAELDSSLERSALEAAVGDLASARAELLRTTRGLRKEDVDAIVADTEAVRARAEQAQTTLERTQKLAQAGAIAADELDRAEKQAEAERRSLESAEAKRKAALSGSRSEDVLVARAKVQAAEGRRDQAQAALERLTIRAPIAGEVLQVKFRAGEYYAPGQDPLVILGDTSKLRVRMDVDERDIAKVTLGAPAFATLNAFPGRRVPGKVVEIGRRLGRKNVRTDDPTERIDTKILEVVIELEDKHGLVPGLRVISYVDVTR